MQALSAKDRIVSFDQDTIDENEPEQVGNNGNTNQAETTDDSRPAFVEQKPTNGQDTCSDCKTQLHVGLTRTDEVSSKKRLRHSSKRSDSTDSHEGGREGASALHSQVGDAASFPIPCPVSPNIADKNLRFEASAPTSNKLKKGGGTYFEGKELPKECKHHPLLISSHSKFNDALLLQATGTLRPPTILRPLRASPRLPARPLIPPSNWEDNVGSSEERATQKPSALAGTEHVLTAQALRIQQEEKMDRLRAYLHRRNEAKRRRRKRWPTYSYQQSLPAAMSPHPPPSESNSAVSPDVLDAAFALVHSLPRVPRPSQWKAKLDADRARSNSKCTNRTDFGASSSQSGGFK